MDNENWAERNREAWNQALEYHQAARNNTLQAGFENPDYSAFDRDCDEVLLKKLDGIDFTDKTIVQMPCNNGRELLSLMRRGAKAAVGFDISDVAIAEARGLAEIAKLNAMFVRTDILEIGEEYNGLFDFIYISEGSLQWFPDLHAYFSVVGRLLKPGGQLLVFEMHPFAYFFENGFDANNPNFDDLTSYFEPGPYGYPGGLDYVGGVEYPAKECYWFMHQVSGIVKAILQNGIQILDFDEYNLEMANNPAAELFDKFPLSYLIKGKKSEAPACVGRA